MPMKVVLDILTLFFPVDLEHKYLYQEKLNYWNIAVRPSGHCCGNIKEVTVIHCIIQVLHEVYKLCYFIGYHMWTGD